MSGTKRLAANRSPNWAFMQKFEIPQLDQPHLNYLTRWRLIQTPWFGIYVHRMDSPDSRPTLHDHPWNFVSIVLRGGYVEATAPCPACAGTGIFRGLQWGSSEWPGCTTCAPGALATGGPSGIPFPRTAGFMSRRVRRLNVKRAEAVHFIASLDRSPTWTLMLVGRRNRVWGYLDPDGKWTAFNEHPHNDEFDAAMAARKGAS